MTQHPSSPMIGGRPTGSSRRLPVQTLLVLALLYLFLVGIRGLGKGFEGLGAGLLESFFAATANPFLGLLVGILGTSLVQSSSVTTSMVVALVAAPTNPLPLASAIPMIMGANIGTTVTNTIVSLGHVSRPAEFRRAFASATCHDFFNLLTVLTLLPLELATGYLEKTSLAITKLVRIGAGPGKLPNPVRDWTDAGLKPVEATVKQFSEDPQIVAIALIVLWGAVIVGSLFGIVQLLRRLMSARLQTYLSRSLDASPYVGLVVGLVVTVMVQSSSITTSVLVPLAGAGVVTTAHVYPITVGANLGTTMTAILASMGTPSATAHLGVQIALVHLLFNMSGTALFFVLPPLRKIPVLLAERFAALAARSRRWAVAYVVFVFYMLPGLAVFLAR